LKDSLGLACLLGHSGEDLKRELKVSKGNVCFKTEQSFMREGEDLKRELKESALD